MGSPIKESQAVRALAVLRRSFPIAGRHEPYESRGSRADLWGPAGAIPAGYPAAIRKRPGVTGPGGDREDVPEASGRETGWACAVEASKVF